MGWLIHCYVSLLLSVLFACSTVTAQNVWPGSSSRYTPTRRPNAQDTHGYRKSYNCKESNPQYDCIFYDVSIDRYPQHPVNFGYGDVRQNNQKNVTFTNSTLRRLPESLLASFQEVEILDLGNLQIETIEERALSHGAYLRELYMGFNNIYNLPASAFISMPSLSKLVLDRNNLQSLPKRIFRHTPNLSALSIANNMLARIDDDTFKQNGALQHLSLSGNTLTHIDLSLIPSLYYGNVSTNQLTTLAIPSAVVVLDASHNRINQVTGPFNDQLTILHLKHNILTDTAWLQNYPGLVHVDLSYNELEHLTNQNFSNMKQLEKLYVSNNRLTTLRLGFTPMPKLQILDLSHNYLLHVEHNQRHFDALKQLYLANNSIVTLKISANNTLETITLSNNDWDCKSLRALLTKVPHQLDTGDSDHNCKPDYQLEQNLCCKATDKPYLDRLLQYIHLTSSAEKLNRACSPAEALSSVQDLSDYMSNVTGGVQLNPSLQAEINELRHETQQLTDTQDQLEKLLHSLDTEIDDNLRRYRVTKDAMVAPSQNLHKVIAHLKSRQAFKLQESDGRRSEANQKKRDVETLEQENKSLQSQRTEKEDMVKQIKQATTQQRTIVRKLEAQKNRNPDTRRITK